MSLGSARMFILRGLVTVAFGVVVIDWPAISLTVLILLFSAFAIVDGALMFIIGLDTPSNEPARPVVLIAGVLTAIVGFATYVWPGLTALVLMVLIALRAVIAGVAEVVSAASVAGHGSEGWLTGAVGLLSIALGTLFLVYPGTGILAAVWTIGLYAIASGALSLTRGWLGALAHV